MLLLFINQLHDYERIQIQKDRATTHSAEDILNLPSVFWATNQSLVEIRQTYGLHDLAI
ncbi:hypothetical protein BDFB_002353 [Asbolus verrucosus]|uniref:Uncharacterized protein n=1 Tax=Asbolus verrucosus TaxID=1661398 RepID=A0A482W1B5_ASBVE|nr:hypothetical protein BDFB_002353 [Asbolus verrucosus]